MTQESCLPPRNISVNSGVASDINAGILGKITTKTLTQQLRELEDQKNVQRIVYTDNPPKVEYALTELGKSIYPVLKSLYDWRINYQVAMIPANDQVGSFTDAAG